MGRIKKFPGEPLVLRGEPSIYSTKYNIATGSRSAQFAKNKQFSVFLKSFFPFYYKTTMPLVLMVKFFLRPSKNILITLRELDNENTPATMSYELCEHVLSLLETMFMVNFNSYRQIVKIDCEKFYSDDPRTEIKLMAWSDYVELFSKNSVDTKTESQHKAV